MHSVNPSANGPAKSRFQFRELLDLVFFVANITDCSGFLGEVNNFPCRCLVCLPMGLYSLRLAPFGLVDS
jgi:hypothetical protein